jgi:DNA-binding Xre family transcriptional regulator
MSAIKTKLKKYLLESGVSQTELYNRINEQCKDGLGMDVISRICCGVKKNYHIYTLLKICIALDCTPNDIIEKEEFIEKQVKLKFRKMANEKK